MTATEKLHEEAEKSRERMNRYLTTEDVAELVRARAETVRYWRQMGTGPKSFRLPGSRRVLYDIADVEKFISEARGGNDAA